MKIFIGSSSEQLPVAKEIKRDLSDSLYRSQVSIVIWDEWFERGEFINLSTWTIIQRALQSFDIAIMLLAPDDRIERRERRYTVTRDNVLVETGAFADALGIENVFLLAPTCNDYIIPSDFLGLNYVRFDYSRGADNSDTYRRICEKIEHLLSTSVEGFYENRDDLLKEELLKNENPIMRRKGKGKLI